MSNDNNDKSIESLIGALTEELKPVERTKHPLFYALPWLAIAGFFAFFVVEYVGVRHDVAEKLRDSVFLFENIVIAALGIVSVIASAYLMIPDMRGKKWLLSVSFTLAVIFVLWNIVKAFSDGLHLPHLRFDHCMKEGLFVAFIPMMALIFFMRSGSTTKPLIMAFMNIFAGASIAYISLRFTCSMDTVGHSTVMHLTPYVVIGSVLGLLARRFYKW
jgi:hypothetical protein